MDDYTLQKLQGRTPYLLFKCLLKILDVSLLGWLGNSPPIPKPPPPIKYHGVQKVVCKAWIQQEAGDGGASATLSRVTVKYSHILNILIQKVEYMLTALEEYEQLRGVVVLPFEGEDLMIKMLRLDLSITEVVNPISPVRMRLVQKVGNLGNIISVHLFNFAACGEAHG